MGQTVDPAGSIGHRSGQTVHRSQASICRERSETLKTRETSHARLEIGHDFDALSRAALVPGYTVLAAARFLTAPAHEQVKNPRVPEESPRRTEYCFDSSTGLLLRTRVLQNGTGQGANGVVTKLTYSGGNPIREESYGGDVQTLATGDLCSLALPANQYRIDHGWQYGVHKSAQYVDAAGIALSFKSLDTDIDLSTGLVKTSRDTSGISTSYEYDPQGRVLWVKPDPTPACAR
jgi:hypothetical protein